MRVSMSIPEIEEFIKSYFKISVGISYVEHNKIDINYVTTFRLVIKRVDSYSILLGYELNWAANLLAKGTKFMVSSKMDDKVLSWNTDSKTLSVNLLYVDVMKDFLAIYHIKTFEVIDNEIVLELVQTKGGIID